MGLVTRELKGGTPLLLTTTTKFGLEQSALAETHIVLEGGELDLELDSVLGEGASVLVTGPRGDDGLKWSGISLDLLSKLIVRCKDFNAVTIVEADGSRGRSLKFPAEHEPVVPQETDLVVPVVGLDVIGKNLEEGNVHRSELFSEQLGVDIGKSITVDHIIQLFSDTRGGLKGVTPGIDVRVLLNKADSELELRHGREIADGLIQNEAIRSVCLGSMLSSDPILESTSRVAGVILAAGGSTRMGGAKVTLEWEGIPMITRAVGAARGAGLWPINVVIGAYGELVREALRGEQVEIVVNEAWEEGQSSSVKVGLDAVRDRSEAVVFLLADMPLVDGELVKALVNEHRKTLSAIIAPWVGGRRGNPILFDANTYHEMEALSGDQGARSLTGQFPIRRIEWDERALFDVDSPDDLPRLS
jgi:molybdenum cofactor cytidylyltransferase